MPVDQRSEVRSQRSEVRGQKSEVGSQRSEVRGRKSEVRGQRSGVRGQGSEVGCRDRGSQALRFRRVFEAFLRAPFFAVADAAVSARSRRARLTDSVSGNTFANSGSMRTRLVPTMA